MNGFGFYKIYQPLHLHFTSSYDLFKYAGKTKSVNEDSFDKRKDRNIFEKWANKLDNPTKAGQVVIANFIYSNTQFIYNEVQEAIDVYNEWKKVRESLTETFKNDCNKLAEHIKTLYFWKSFLGRTPKGNNAPLLQLYLHKRIHPESLVIVDSISDPFIDQWEVDYEIDPLISDHIFTLKKYRPFVKFDKEKVSGIFKELVISNEQF